jgi:ClpX C4-type zinc finger
VVINEPLLTKARAAGAALAEAERQVQLARAEYHSIVRRMHLVGGSLREIAQVLGLSHQRVQQMVGDAGGSWWQRVWRARNLKHNLACTFCQRSQDIVAKLIAGPNVFICDACVALAEQSMTGAPATHGIVLAGDQTKARCSFCRKRRTTERPILKGPAAGICAQCLNTCRQILIDSTG